MKNMVTKILCKTVSVCKRVCKSKDFTLAGAAVFTLFAVNAYATTGTAVGNNVQNDELKGVWQKVGSIFEGTGGKLAALGIIAVSIWNREKIGIPYMGLGIAAGILLPSLPSIINSFTYTI